MAWNGTRKLAQSWNSSAHSIPDTFEYLIAGLIQINPAIVLRVPCNRDSFG